MLANHSPKYGINMKGDASTVSSFVEPKATQVGCAGKSQEGMKIDRGRDSTKQKERRHRGEKDAVRTIGQLEEKENGQDAQAAIWKLKETFVK